MGPPTVVLVLLASVWQTAHCESVSWDYSSVFSRTRTDGLTFDDVPGFTRSAYERDHAFITPESRVFAPQPGWSKALTAHLISAASGASFAMYLADIKPGGSSGSPPASVERFAFVLDGAVNASGAGSKEEVELHADDYAYFPAGHVHSMSSATGAGLIVYERVLMASLKGRRQQAFHGTTAQQPVLPVDGEVFALRKLMPQGPDHDFNIHVMDFRPGEYLNVKEVHYNQHGLLLLQGKGIYRLANQWYPIQAGDAIWMAPYVLQWYAALGSQDSRYILYKDTTADPVLPLWT